jgi:hypothetical protein
MSKLFKEMAQGTAEACAYTEGERKGYKITLPETTKKTKRVVEAILEMNDDQLRSDLIDKAEHEKIATRHMHKLPNSWVGKQ